MRDQFRNIGDTAKGLARNPLGIIALFIVLVYGFASLVTAFAGSFTSAERLPPHLLPYPLSCARADCLRVVGKQTQRKAVRSERLQGRGKTT